MKRSIVTDAPKFVMREAGTLARKPKKVKVAVARMEQRLDPSGS